MARKKTEEATEPALGQPSIAAFVEDEITRQLLEPILTDRGWPPGVLHRGGAGEAARAIGAMACPQILIVDLAQSDDPRADIESLAEVCEPETLVLTMGSHNDVTLYRDLIHAGVQDYLLKPLNGGMLTEAVDTLLATYHSAAEPLEEEAAIEQRRIAVIGVRGGLGASTMVTNIAWGMARKGAPAAILDLDLNFGSTAMQFDLEPGRGLIDALENPTRVDGLFLDRAVVKPSDHLSILAAEAPIGGLLPPAAGAETKLLDALADNFSTIIIDLPRHALNQHSSVLESASDVFLLTDQSIEAARDCIRLLGFLKNSPSQAKIHVVMCHTAISMPEVSRDDFVNSIEKDIVADMPIEPKVFLNAAQNGKVVIETAPNSKAGQTYKKLLALLSPEPVDAQGGGWLARLMKK